MGKHIRDFLRIPPEIRPQFWQDSIPKDRLSLLVICIMIFGMEMYNMARVLLWSDSKLGTLNNRIYFGMYCALWLAAALHLVLRHLLRGGCGGRCSTARWCSFCCGTWDSTPMASSAPPGRRPAFSAPRCWPWPSSSRTRVASA